MPKRKIDYLSIAMKYYPEVKKKVSETGLDVHKRDLLPFMDLFKAMMNEAYDKGYKDGMNAQK
ncbi:ComZ family protein [Pradoshia sp.]